MESFSWPRRPKAVPAPTHEPTSARISWCYAYIPRTAVTASGRHPPSSWGTSSGVLMADRTTVGQRLSIRPRTARHACVWVMATPIAVGGRPALTSSRSTAHNDVPVLDPPVRAEGAAPGLPGVACRGDTGVTRQALLLDVKEALVDEFVDAEGA